MDCRSCHALANGAGLLTPDELASIFGVLDPRAPEAVCATCGTRYLLRRPPKLGRIAVDRAADLAPSFEGRWEWSTAGGRPGEGDRIGYRLVLAREGDRLSGELEWRRWNEYAPAESLSAVKWKVEGEVVDQIGRITAAGDGLWRDGADRETFHLAAAARFDFFGRKERCLFAGESADAARHHETDVVLTPATE